MSVLVVDADRLNIVFVKLQERRDRFRDNIHTLTPNLPPYGISRCNGFLSCTQHTISKACIVRVSALKPHPWLSYLITRKRPEQTVSDGGPSTLGGRLVLPKFDVSCALPPEMKGT